LWDEVVYPVAKRKGGIIIAAAAVLGVVAVATVLDSGGLKEVRKADTGGGAVAASPAPPAPFAISTLGAVGTAAQDPGGGGGGTGVPGHVGGPSIQGAQGAGGAPGIGNSGDTYFLSGVNLLDPNRSATTTGDNTFGGPGLGTAAGGVGTVVGGLGAGGSGSATGCATPPDVDYYSTPFRIPTGFRGTPHLHLRISGGGTVKASIFAKTADDNCVLVTSGSGGISGGIADFSLGGRNYAFPLNSTPVLVISAGGQHTISTGSDNPSFLTLPGLYGV
jgi:hypothetical protein